jgi:hypothetical protein
MTVLRSWLVMTVWGFDVLECVERCWWLCWSRRVGDCWSSGVLVTYWRVAGIGVLTCWWLCWGLDLLMCWWRVLSVLMADVLVTVWGTSSRLVNDCAELCWWLCWCICIYNWRVDDGVEISMCWSSWRVHVCVSFGVLITLLRFWRVDDCVQALACWWLCWCLDALMTVLMSWRVDYCVEVFLTVLMTVLRFWVLTTLLRFDVLVTLLRYWLGRVEVLACVLRCWRCWWLCWGLDVVTLLKYWLCWWLLTYWWPRWGISVCWGVDVLVAVLRSRRPGQSVEVLTVLCWRLCWGIVGDRVGGLACVKVLMCWWLCWGFDCDCWSLDGDDCVEVSTCWGVCWGIDGVDVGDCVEVLTVTVLESWWWWLCWGLDVLGSLLRYWRCWCWWLCWDISVVPRWVTVYCCWRVLRCSCVGDHVEVSTCWCVDVLIWLYNVLFQPQACSILCLSKFGMLLMCRCRYVDLSVSMCWSVGVDVLICDVNNMLMCHCVDVNVGLSCGSAIAQRC